MGCSPPGSSVHGILQATIYWSALDAFLQGNLSDPGIELESLALAGGFFTTEPPGKLPQYMHKSQQMTQSGLRKKGREKILKL